MIVLNDNELDLLLWLSKEDQSQYGECHGKALDKLVELDLAYIHSEESEWNNTFIAKRGINARPNIMYRAVSLTETGYTLAKEGVKHEQR